MWKKGELWLAICKVAINEKVSVGRSMSLAIGARHMYYLIIYIIYYIL